MTIKAGDLVVVTRPTPCCGNNSSLGRVFKVTKIEIAEVGCSHCDFMERNVPIARGDKNYVRRISRLTRIDPLPESETNRDEVTA